MKTKGLEERAFLTVEDVAQLMNVSKIDLAEFPGVFGPLGVRVRNAPKRKATR